MLVTWVKMGPKFVCHLFREESHVKFSAYPNSESTKVKQGAYLFPGKKVNGHGITLEQIMHALFRFVDNRLDTDRIERHFTRKDTVDED